MAKKKVYDPKKRLRFRCYQCGKRRYIEHMKAAKTNYYYYKKYVCINCEEENRGVLRNTKAIPYRLSLRK